MGRLFLAAGLLAALQRIDAAVVWDSVQAAAEAKPDDDQVILRFPFSVSGQAVAFLPSQIPCDCASAQSDRPRYQPGEAGVFTVVYPIGDKTGAQEVEIDALTDDAAQPRTTLTARIRIPQLLVLSRTVLIWDAATPPGPQRVTATVAGGHTVRQVTAKVAGSTTSCRVEVAQDGRSFTVIADLKPGGGRKPIRIDLDTDLPVQRQARTVLWVIDRRP